MSFLKTLALCAVLLCFVSAQAEPPVKIGGQTELAKSSAYDWETWIDANSLLMFVTNTGSFAHQVANTFGKSNGLYFPFTSLDDILDETNENTVVFAAGPWFGAIDDATGDTLTVIAEFTDEYWPGPMNVIAEIQGNDTTWTFDPDGAANPNYRVYKLYADSLESNPGGDYADYLAYAVDQGAPVDEFGEPAMLGDQMLWTVFNDANPAAKTNGASGTDPLGIEIQQTVWASAEVTGEDLYYGSTSLEVAQTAPSTIKVYAWVVDPGSVTGDSYRVTFEDSTYIDTVVNTFADPPDTTFTERHYAWHLDNTTSVTRVLEWQYLNHLSDPVEGIVVLVEPPPSAFAMFEVVANNAGPLDPPEPGAFCFADFPVPTEFDPDGYITERQQATGDGMWGIHTADNGGSCGGGERASFQAFSERVTRYGGNTPFIGEYDFEMRFTGSLSEPGVEGSYAVEAFVDDNVFWVPFELWRIGSGTPEDPSDDVRLIPIILDDYGEPEEWPGNDQYGLESWGCVLDETGNGDGEHSTSGGDDDPFTDWVYFYLPIDQTPGESGYLDYEGYAIANDVSNMYARVGNEIIARIVLVNWNAGAEPPFNQDCPEQGTVFRITTVKDEIPTVEFTFSTSPLEMTTTPSKGQDIYIKYLIYNKGGKTLNDCFFSLWCDPDIGGQLDDLVGCDTLDNVFFSYNDLPPDRDFGHKQPAVGFKYLCGPLAYSPGDSGYFNGVWIEDYKNMDMSTFARYVNGTDPQNYRWTYQYMNGLDASVGGAPFVNGTKYQAPGDPVTETGDLDCAPDDRRMMGTCGPFDMQPGDSQFVLIRMAVGQGDSWSESITKMREILNAPFDFTVGVNDGDRESLPKGFSVGQNYPNPFNPKTTIKYSLPTRSRVSIDIYNIVGQRVRRLLDESRPAGTHTVVWDGTDQSGKAVSTGVYFYRVKAGDYLDQKKMVLLK